jgi:hypothetical protein
MTPWRRRWMRRPALRGPEPTGVSLSSTLEAGEKNLDVLANWFAYNYAHMVRARVNPYI